MLDNLLTMNKTIWKVILKTWKAFFFVLNVTFYLSQISGIIFAGSKVSNFNLLPAILTPHLIANTHLSNLICFFAYYIALYLSVYEGDTVLIYSSIF
jgi:hypothetical protein